MTKYYIKEELKPISVYDFMLQWDGTIGPDELFYVFDAGRAGKVTASFIPRLSNNAYILNIKMMLVGTPNFVIYSGHNNKFNIIEPQHCGQYWCYISNDNKWIKGRYDKFGGFVGIDRTINCFVSYNLNRKPELEPCPVCKRRAFVTTEEYLHWHYVWCRQCNIRTIGYLDRNMAVNAWNELHHV